MAVKGASAWFGARWVDDVGEPIAGLQVGLLVGGQAYHLTTNENGLVLLEGIGAAQGALRVLDAGELRQLVKPRWARIREGTVLVPGEATRVLFLMGEKLPDIAIGPERLLTVSVQPHVVRARFPGGLFEADKSFLLPGALHAVHELRCLCRSVRRALVVVGRVRGGGALEAALALERAESLGAYLVGDAGAWLSWFDADRRHEARWDFAEEHLMMAAVMGPRWLLNEAGWRSYQRFHNRVPANERAPGFELLMEDGLMGPATRRQLVGEYMRLAGGPLEQVSIAACRVRQSEPNGGHSGGGKGEELPLEVFFFDTDLGARPSVPSGAGSGEREYEEWCARTAHVHELGAPGALAGLLP